MKVKAIKTHLIKPCDEIFDVLNLYLPKISEKTIIAITSKIVSLCQGRVVDQDNILKKYDLIINEADAYLPEDQSCYDVHLTIKNNILIPSAGIDESNGNGQYILYPHHIQQTAVEIWEQVRKQHKVDELGIIITDSHTTPLRRGVTGITLGWCGFEPLHSYVGEPDIFNNPLKVTQINILDALAASAVFVMGEGCEQTPMAIMNDVPRIKYLSRAPTVEEKQGVSISLEDDIYAPLLKAVGWIWNKKAKS